MQLFLQSLICKGNLIQRYTDTEGAGTYYFYDFLHKAFISGEKLITAVEMAKVLLHVDMYWLLI